MRSLCIRRLRYVSMVLRDAMQVSDLLHLVQEPPLACPVLLSVSLLQPSKVLATLVNDQVTAWRHTCLGKIIIRANDITRVRLWAIEYETLTKVDKNSILRPRGCGCGG